VGAHARASIRRTTIARKIKTKTRDSAAESTQAPVQQVASAPRRSRRMARQNGSETNEAEATEEKIKATAAGTTTEQPESTLRPAPAPRLASKISAVIALLERSDGATLAELVEATGWLPHTTCAALTGLKKKGRTLTKDKRRGHLLPHRRGSLIGRCQDKLEASRAALVTMSPAQLRVEWARVTGKVVPTSARPCCAWRSAMNSKPRSMAGCRGSRSSSWRNMSRPRPGPGRQR
jgi:hypothetical protein